MQARQERQRSMCLTTSCGRRPVLFQHLLDEIDPAARAIEFVAEQHIGRTGRGAKSAMHAGAQDLVGFRDIGIGELREAEFGLHAADPRIIRPRLRMFFGSKLWRTRSLKRGKAALLGMKHIDIAPHLVGCAQQHGVTADGIDARAHQCRLGIGLGRQRRPDQAAAPIVDHVAAGIARQRLAERAAGGRRTDDPPHRPRAERAIGRERLDVANRTPDRRRGRVLQNLAPSQTARAALPSAAARWAAEAVMPSSRSSVTASLRRSEIAERRPPRPETPNSAHAPRRTHRTASPAPPSSPGWRRCHPARAAPACVRSRASASPSTSPPS